jgi:hypothetical protein
MRRLVIAGAVASLIAGADVLAQAGQERESKDKTVTLTGCLAKGETADSFTLTNARMGGSATGTTGEKAAGKEAAAATYQLSPGKVQKLEAHVGHTVEITGTLDASPSAKSGASSDTAASASKGKAPAQHVTVTGMKHISGTCS